MRLNLKFIPSHVIPPKMRPALSHSNLETTLAVLPASSDEHRVELVHVTDAAGSHVELRQQSWGDGVGWFTQSSVRLEPQQLATLKQSLGIAGGCPTSMKQTSQRASSSWSPRVVRAETA